MRWPFLLLIYLYRWTIGPLLGSCCRFVPSCSEYALEAFHHLPLHKALLFSCWRLLRCGPWHCGGYDPLFGPEELNDSE